MSETGAIMLAAFCARNVSRTALSASEWGLTSCASVSVPFQKHALSAGNAPINHCSSPAIYTEHSQLYLSYSRFFRGKILENVHAL